MLNIFLIKYEHVSKSGMYLYYAMLNICIPNNHPHIALQMELQSFNPPYMVQKQTKLIYWVRNEVPIAK